MGSGGPLFVLGLAALRVSAELAIAFSLEEWKLAYGIHLQQFDVCLCRAQHRLRQRRAIGPLKPIRGFLESRSVLLAKRSPRLSEFSNHAIRAAGLPQQDGFPSFSSVSITFSHLSAGIDSPPFLRVAFRSHPRLTESVEIPTRSWRPTECRRVIGRLRSWTTVVSERPRVTSKTERSAKFDRV